VTNQLSVTLVIVFLGALALLSTAGSIWLIHDGTSDAALLVAVTSPGTAALGALAGILASTRVAQVPAQTEVVRAGPSAPLPPPVE
jgi:hypothetical protein